MWSDDEFAESQRCDSWTYQKINILVCLYWKYKCLWKKDNLGYLDNKQRYKAYKKIYKKLNMANVKFVEVIMMIREVRKMYVNELKRILYAQCSGYDYEPNAIWFWRLHQFLYPYLDYNETVKLNKVLSNCTTSEDETPVSLSEIKVRKRKQKFSKREKKQKIIKNVKGNLDITFTRNSSFCSSSNRPCSDSEITCRSYCARTSRNFDIKNQISSCRAKLTNNISERDLMSYRLKNYNLKNDEVTEDSKLMKQKTSELESRVQSRIRSDISCLTVEESCDQFDLFAKSVACQLRKMNPNCAFKAQKAIQKILKSPKVVEKIEDSVHFIKNTHGT